MGRVVETGRCVLPAQAGFAGDAFALLDEGSSSPIPCLDPGAHASPVRVALRFATTPANPARRRAPIRGWLEQARSTCRARRSRRATPRRGAALGFRDRVDPHPQTPERKDALVRAPDKHLIRDPRSPRTSIEPRDACPVRNGYLAPDDLQPWPKGAPRLLGGIVRWSAIGRGCERLRVTRIMCSATGLEPATSGVTGRVGGHDSRRRGPANTFVCRDFSRWHPHDPAWHRGSSNRRLGHEWATKCCLSSERTAAGGGVVTGTRVPPVRRRWSPLPGAPAGRGRWSRWCATAASGSARSLCWAMPYRSCCG